MASFNLVIESKPFHADNVDQFMERLTFTQTRDELPLLLEGIVPLTVWQDTHDKLLANIRASTESTSKVNAQASKYSCMLVAPCLLPVMLPFFLTTRKKISKVANSNEDAFLRMVHTQAAIYQYYGVKVTAAKEQLDDEMGGIRYMENEYVGLRFHLESADKALKALADRQSHRLAADMDGSGSSHSSKRVRFSFASTTAETTVSDEA